jgi:hypothetical protein
VQIAQLVRFEDGLYSWDEELGDLVAVHEPPVPEDSLCDAIEACWPELIERLTPRMLERGP